MGSHLCCFLLSIHLLTVPRNLFRLYFVFEQCKQRVFHFTVPEAMYLKFSTRRPISVCQVLFLSQNMQMLWEVPSVKILLPLALRWPAVINSDEAGRNTLCTLWWTFTVGQFLYHKPNIFLTLPIMPVQCGA